MRVFGAPRLLLRCALSLQPPLAVHGACRRHSSHCLVPTSRRPMMGTMSSISRNASSSSNTDADVTAAVAAHAQELLTRIHAALDAAFQRHARDGSSAMRALSVDEIAPLRELCDQLQPEHFKLRIPEVGDRTKGEYDQQQSSRGHRNRVRYQHIFENELFSMGIFVLPPGASIPLHDHPDMSVISRVLYGRLHVTSCDFASPKEADHLFPSRHHSTSPVSPDSSDASSSRRIARIFQDAMIAAPHTTALMPDEGNLHEFVADDETGCAIFDILTPPYEPEDGRDCTYYRAMSGTKTSENGRAYVELEEFEPYDFEVVSEPYRGPRLLTASSS